MSNIASSAPPLEQGAAFVFQSERDRQEAIEKAFDYRGDVTLQLANGKSIEGYLFNRDSKGKPPWISIFVKDSPEPQVIPCADIAAITFSGRNTADGKSWRDWVDKKESERQTEAETIKQEMAKQGFL